MSCHGFVSGTHMWGQSLFDCLTNDLQNFPFWFLAQRCHNEVTRGFFLHLQSQEEPDGDGSAADSEFGGHRVLAVMRPPPSQDIVSRLQPPIGSAHKRRPSASARLCAIKIKKKEQATGGYARCLTTCWHPPAVRASLLCQSRRAADWLVSLPSLN